MDVILDTNIYIGLLRSKGADFLTGNKFVELLAYLRGSGHKLVIPDVVLQELEARYVELVDQTSKQAQDSWASYARNLKNPPAAPLAADPKAEWQRIKKDLLNPGKGVSVVHYDDYSKVPTKEVVARGANRKLPANAKGEELRDVIAWFMTLEYARNSQVAFVSEDGDYNIKNGLHPDLAADLKAYNADIKLFPSLNEFVTNISKPRPLTDTEFNTWISADQLIKPIELFVSGADLPSKGKVKSANVKEPVLRKGSKYEIDSASFYVEFSVLVDAELEIKPSVYVPIFDALSSGSLYQPAHLNPNRWEPSRWRSRYVVEQSKLFDFPNKNIFTSGDLPIDFSPDIHLTAILSATFTLRVVNQKPESLELESVSFVGSHDKVEPTATA